MSATISSCFFNVALPHSVQRHFAGDRLVSLRLRPPLEMELDCRMDARLAKCAAMQGVALGSSAAFDKADWAVNLSDHKLVQLRLQVQNILAGEQGLPDFSAPTTRVTGPALMSSFAALAAEITGHDALTMHDP